MVRDSGDYECQVSGPNHTSISKLVSLTVIGETIVGWTDGWTLVGSSPSEIPNHTSISKLVSLTVIGETTT